MNLTFPPEQETVHLTADDVMKAFGCHLPRFEWDIRTQTLTIAAPNFGGGDYLALQVDGFSRKQGVKTAEVLNDAMAALERFWNEKVGRQPLFPFPLPKFKDL